MTKREIIVNGKKYGYWVMNDGSIAQNIRSEDNPHKTPYLKESSKKWSEVMAEILANREN